MRLGTYDLDVKKLHVSRVAHTNGSAPSSQDELPEPPMFAEIGASGKSDYSGSLRDAFNSQLSGKRGLRIFDQMRKTDAQVRSSLLIFKAPVLSAQWYVEPFSQDPEDIEVAQFVHFALHNMHRDFPKFMKESLSGLDFGFYAFEKCFEPALWTAPRKGAHTRPVVKWMDLAPRHPLTIDAPEKDANGRLAGLWHVKTGTVTSERVLLPRPKILLFTWDEEADDPFGNSVLRSAYEHWYYKHNLYKVDAIQKERHGIGIPDIQLPPGYTAEDKALAREMGRNLRTNEKAYIVRPHGMEVGFVKPEGNLVNALDSAKHHNREIAVNVMTQFIDDTGSAARDESHISLADRVLRHLADWFRSEINHNAIPELVDYNFKVKGYPTLNVRRLTGNSEARALAVTLRNLVEPGIITPTPELEAFMTEVLEFPAPSNEAMDRDFEDRITKHGLLVKTGFQGTQPATNPNRQDPGNQAAGQSPSGNPTE